MPIYEYECAKCGKTIEVIQKFSDKPLKKHAGCGGNLTKLNSEAGFQFKGTGWYGSDYARKGQSESKESAKTDVKETSSNDKKDGSADKSAEKKAAKKDSPGKAGGAKD